MLECWKDTAQPWPPSNLPTVEPSNVPLSSPTPRPRQRHDAERDLLAAARVFLGDLGVAAGDLLAQQLVIENIAAGRLRRRLAKRHDESREYHAATDHASFP